MLPGGLGRFVPCSSGANHCRLRHIGWEKCGHGVTSRLVRVPLSFSFITCWHSSIGAVREVVVDGVGQEVHWVSGSGPGRKRIRLNRKTPAHVAGFMVQSRPRVWKRLRHVGFFSVSIHLITRGGVVIRIVWDLKAHVSRVARF